MRHIFCLLLVYVGAAFGQNTCAYTFSYPKQDFAFCLTTSGTLASLQSPVGTEHLNATTPMEGFGFQYMDAEGGHGQDGALPGDGWFNPAVVTQVHPGKMPITFDYGYFKVFVSASPNTKSVTFRMSVFSCKDPCRWEGTIWRVAQPEVDGRNPSFFGISNSAFAYFNHTLQLFGGCPAIDPLGAADVFSYGQELCQPTAAMPLPGAAIYNVQGFVSQNGKTRAAVFTYRVF